ncbi:MAG TPA: hypothetical protein VF077_05375 [Nitrospiraceae bacterium]
MLPDGQADYSLNCYLFSGALIGWRQPKKLYQLKTSSSKYAYRVPNKTSNDTSITAKDSFWMEFQDPDTTVMHTPVVNDIYNRYYFSAPSHPPKYNTYQRIMDGLPPWILGVPGSGCSPGVTIDGGGSAVQEGWSTVQPGYEASIDYQVGNSIFLIPITPDGSLLVAAVNFMPKSDSATIKFHAVVYNDLNGKPYQLLGSGDEVQGIVSGTATLSTFTNSIGLTADTTYWIGIAHDEPMYVQVASVAKGGASFSNTYSNNPPDTAPASTPYPFVWQMWTDLIGSSVFAARGYLYTWVTEYGEEGPPSEVSVVNGWSNGVWTISLYTPTPENMGVDRNITKTRIYRTVSDQYGRGSYFLVAEIPVTQATYVDTIGDDVVSLNSQLTSLYWTGPPADLKAMIPFPNGITVGFKANEVWFSEAYRPHAWPPNYVLTTEFPIVGIGVCGQSIVVCTQGSPYLVTGINPASMALTKINLPEPCIHRGSIVSTDTTVLYVSQNGLIQISQTGAGGNVTEGWISRERWQDLVPQKQIRAVKHATSYFAFGCMIDYDSSVAKIGFTVELSNEDQTSFTIWPQPGGHRLGFSRLNSPNGFDIENMLLDAWTGVGLLIQDGWVYYYDFTDLNPTIVPYKWRSKTFQQMARKNFQAMRVWFSVPESTPPQIARDVSHPQLTLGANQYGVIRVYVDGDLWTTRELRSSGELLRIFSGIKGEQWQFEVEGRVNVSNLQIATSVKELALV